MMTRKITNDLHRTKGNAAVLHAVRIIYSIPNGNFVFSPSDKSHLRARNNLRFKAANTNPPTADKGFRFLAQDRLIVPASDDCVSVFVSPNS